MTEGFKSKELFLQVQKKFLNKFTNKKVIKLLIDDQNSKLLDNLYKLLKLYTGNKKESEKVMKNIIKMIVKLSILSRNDQFDSNEIQIAQNFKNKYRELVMIIISFYEIEFSYDKSYLVSCIFTCKEMLNGLSKRHLTNKSLSRIDTVFDFFSNSIFLDSIFIKRNSDLKITETMLVIIDCLKEQIDKYL